MTDSIATLSQENDICGIWIEEKKQSHIEIYKTNNTIDIIDIVIYI